MEFDPHALTQEKLHRLRDAAELAWDDTTRHHHYTGHPQPAAGQCYVTSRWMASKLGGYVGEKNGHFFWVSPDKQYAVDLTGDAFSTAPEDMAYVGMKLDPEDTGWEPHPDQMQHTPGPIIYKRADHHLFKGMRIRDIQKENDRVHTFIKRADAAYGS